MPNINNRRRANSTTPAAQLGR
jgi:hypothetical protein